MPPRTDSAVATPPAADPPAAPAAALLKSVRFTRTFSKYHRNDLCGFPVAYADQLIRKGVCIEIPESRAVEAMVKK